MLRSTNKLRDFAIQASDGAIGAVQAAARHPVRHFPADGRLGNELPDKPLCCEACR